MDSLQHHWLGLNFLKGWLVLSDRIAQRHAAIDFGYEFIRFHRGVGEAGTDMILQMQSPVPHF